MQYADVERAVRPNGDTYGTEVGDVLFSLQALLIRESQGGVVDVSFTAAQPRIDRPRWGLEDVTIVPEASAPPVIVQPRFESRPVPEPPPALFDLATGAPTQQSLANEIERHGSRVRAGLVALDVTPIGEIRARQGDEIADAILRTIVEAVPFALRAEDQVYRTGIDELTLCVPGTNLSDAAAMSLRLQMAVKDVLVRRELPTVILSIRPYQQVAA